MVNDLINLQDENDATRASLDQSTVLTGDEIEEFQRRGMDYREFSSDFPCKYADLQLSAQSAANSYPQ
jgi:hypothetical protein